MDPDLARTRAAEDAGIVDPDPDGLGAGTGDGTRVGTGATGGADEGTTFEPEEDPEGATDQV